MRDPSKQKDVDNLERVQRRAARLVKGVYRRGPEVSVNQIVQDLRWRSSARLTMFYKAINGDVAILIDELITKNQTPATHVKKKKKGVGSVVHKGVQLCYY